MTSWSLFPVALVLLCYRILCSLGCDMTGGLQEDFSFLHQVSRASLVPCLKDRNNFNFPEEAMKVSQLQREDVTVILHDMLLQIFTLFTQNAVPPSWNQTQLMQLLIGLDQQLEQLEGCQQDVKYSLRSVDPGLALRSYFRRINQYLQRKEYSRCAWEITRVEIRKCFLFMSDLTRKFRD